MQKRCISDVILALLLGFLKKSEYKRLCTQILIVEKQDVELKGANISLLKNNIKTENFTCKPPGWQLLQIWLD